MPPPLGRICGIGRNDAYHVAEGGLSARFVFELSTDSISRFESYRAGCVRKIMSQTLEVETLPRGVFGGGFSWRAIWRSSIPEGLEPSR